MDKWYLERVLDVCVELAATRHEIVGLVWLAEYYQRRLP
jgi:hypothetical protein